MLSVEVNIRSTLKYHNMKGFRMKVFRILKILLLYMHILDGITALTIDASNGRCGSTINLATYEQVYLNYEGETRVNGECTYTFTNNDWNKEICIRKTWGQSNINCVMAFSYYIGQKNRYNDMSCNDFYLEPLCAKTYKVFASFKNGVSGGFGGVSLSKAHVVIYLKLPPPTTTYSYSDDSDDGGAAYVTSALIIIFSVLFMVGCCICCARCLRQTHKPVPIQGRDPINNAPNQGVGLSNSRPSTTQDRNGTEQTSVTVNSSYNWGPPSYEECINQPNYGQDTSRTPGNKPHLHPFTVTSGTKDHDASDEMESPPPYESLTSISHL